MTFQSDANSPSSHALLSHTDRIAVMWQDFLLLVGRIMIGWIYVQSGWRKMGDIPGFVSSMPRRGLPEFLGYIAPPVEVIGGLAILLGFATRYGALLILLFTIIATFSSHAYWSVPDAQRGAQHTQFWKNVTMMGGLVVLFVTAGGRISLDHLLFRKKS